MAIEREVGRPVTVEKVATLVKAELKAGTAVKVVRRAGHTRTVSGPLTRRTPLVGRSIRALFPDSVRVARARSSQDRHFAKGGQHPEQRRVSDVDSQEALAEPAPLE